MMVYFDDETATMQVREPFLERVYNGEQLPFMHRIIGFGAGEFPEVKGNWMGPMLSFLPQDCADANVICVAGYNVRL